MKNDFLFGINLHNRGYAAYPEETLDEQLDDCVAMNQDLIRFNCQPETEEGYAYLERVIEGVHRRGMKFMLVVDCYRWYQPEDPETYYEKIYYEIASRLRGKIDIYQMFNEMDVSAMLSGDTDGKEEQNYDPALWRASALAVRGALKGIRAGDPNAKTCVNFSWWHTAIIYHMVKEGCDFDIVGLDWYSDMETASSIEAITADVAAHLPDKEIMICESNYWIAIAPDSGVVFDETAHNETQAKWVEDFAEKVYHLDQPQMKGVIFYEFHDEPCFEQDCGHYQSESHYGFVACDRNGQNRRFKPAFYSLRNKISALRGEE